MAFISLVGVFAGGPAAPKNRTEKTSKTGENLILTVGNPGADDS